MPSNYKACKPTIVDFHFSAELLQPMLVLMLMLMPVLMLMLMLQFQSFVVPSRALGCLQGRLQSLSASLGLG
jgi:hypothetical protein